MDQLNQIIGVSATDRPDGTVQLAVKGSGVLLVDGVRTARLTTAANWRRTASTSPRAAWR